MEFIKYQHVEKFGNVETEGIDFGKCYIFPKIDGANGSLWVTTGINVFNNANVLCAGSRNRKLSYPDDDNQGFFKWCVEEKGQDFSNFFRKYNNLRLYGEWLIPHTLKTYNELSWNKFYVFDVVDGYTNLSYDVYKPLLEEFNIDYIPPIAIINNPTYEKLIGFIDRNVYLIKDGEGVGEGIVIKNYEYKNKFGRQTWAKIVSNDFKTKHSKNEPTVVKEKKNIEESVVNLYITISLVEKEYAKIVSEKNGWSSKFIPRLLNTVFYCLIKEESWNFIKKFKNPIIDFRRLSFLTTAKIKEIKPEIF